MESTATARSKIAQRLARMERSQGWLARQLKVTRQSVHGWLSGKEVCPRSRQAQIALTLGMKPSELFDADGHPLREDPPSA